MKLFSTLFSASSQRKTTTTHHLLLSQKRYADMFTILKETNDNTIAQFKRGIDTFLMRNVFSAKAQTWREGKNIKSVRYTTWNGALRFKIIGGGNVTWYTRTGRVHVSGNAATNCRPVVEEAERGVCALVFNKRGIVDPWVKLTRPQKRRPQKRRRKTPVVNSNTPAESPPQYLVWVHYIGLLLTLFPSTPPPSTDTSSLS